MVLSVERMTGSQLYLQVKRQPIRHLFIALLSVIIIISLLFNFGRVSSKLGSLIPSPHVGGEYSSKGTPLSDIYNRTLGFGKIFVVSLPERTDHRDMLLLASTVSGIEIDFIDGIHGDKIPTKALPANWNKDLQPSNIGAWRAHLNAISEIIHNNLSSALIMEDDVDWDVRLKQSLHDFAISANALLQISPAHNINFDNLPPTAAPQYSPYGDGWDMIWLGHCGMHLPFKGGVVLQENDVTVPQHRHLHSFMAAESTPLSIYPEHTRAIMRDVNEGTCSLAYAVTQSAARQILYDLGLERLDESFDLALRGWCEGSKTGTPRVCLGVLPQLFDHYRRVGPGDIDSDISAPKPEFRETAYTNNIRWSVMMNMKKILNGETDYDDQYPDS